MSKDDLEGLDLDALADILRKNPDLRDKLDRKIESEEIIRWSIDREQAYINRYEEITAKMNEEEFEITKTRPYKLWSFRGSLAKENGEPICVICDKRENDMNVLGEQFHYGKKPRFSGVYKDLVMEHGESTELFEEIPETVIIDLITGDRIEQYDYDIDDVEIDS